MLNQAARDSVSGIWEQTWPVSPLPSDCLRIRIRKYQIRGRTFESEIMYLFWLICAKVYPKKTSPCNSVPLLIRAFGRRKTSSSNVSATYRLTIRKQAKTENCTYT